MILAAGRGERMRPLTDATPKPLLAAGGKPLIVWQIEALARAGFRDIVINVVASRDAARRRARRRRALRRAHPLVAEPEPLETAGGIATALPLLPAGPVLVVSGDVWTRFDYATLPPRARRDGRRSGRAARASRDGAQSAVPSRTAISRSTASRIALDGPAAAHLRQHRALRHARCSRTSARREAQTAAALPALDRARHSCRGERYDGPWANVGTPADLAALDARAAPRASLAAHDSSRTAPP